MNKSVPQKLTILSSFYNVAQFIPNCIAMLKNQTNADFRVIMVDDGSTDESYKICLDAIGDDQRFSVIRHEQNRGLGSGRITGIENTKTEYLTYIDPDDFLAPNAVENYLQDIRTTGADYIVYDYYTSNDEKKELVTDNSKTADDLFETKSKLVSHVWHKVVKTELYSHFDYSFLSEVSFSEDLFNSINCFLNTDNVSIIHRAYYTYKYNGNSLVHNRTEKSILENIEVNKNLLQNPKLKEKPLIQKYIEEDSFHAFGQLIFPNVKNDFQKKPHFREWRNLHKECHITIPKNTSFFVRTYIFFIKKNCFFIALLMFLILRIKGRIYYAEHN